MINVYCLKVNKKYNRKFVTNLKNAVDKYLTVEHNDDYVHHVYEYGTKHPTALNASEVIHGVINTERRVFINFSGYLDWENI